MDLVPLASSMARPVQAGENNDTFGTPWGSVVVHSWSGEYIHAQAAKGTPACVLGKWLRGVMFGALSGTGCLLQVRSWIRGVLLAGHQRVDTLPGRKAAGQPLATAERRWLQVMLPAKVGDSDWVLPLWRPELEGMLAWRKRQESRMCSSCRRVRSS